MPTEPTQTAEAFVKETEARLSTIVRSIEGAGDCRVLVTLANGVEYVYATEQKTNTDRQEDGSRLTERDDSESTAVVVDTDEGRKGLLVTEIQPTVRGVVVVCEGGDREEVRRRIIEAVTVAMDLSSKRVCVTKLT
jgi:stage III sporulation protein AG